ncbi:MAG: carbamoyltransferase HypF [Gammaproteobacteria bacterium]
METGYVRAAANTVTAVRSEQLRVRGIVQGVGFRPTVWRIARELELAGDVRNDGDGVLIRVAGPRAALDRFADRLRLEPPPLARIEAVERQALPKADGLPAEFRIVASAGTAAHTGVAADAAVCAACAEETLNPFSRRYRYPFTNCTHCGPRLSIIRAIPYDRANTSMADFRQCPQCLSEYQDPADRRFHAQPNACHVCGPRASLVRSDGRVMCTEHLTQLDDVDAACTLLQRGEIVAIKGVGGFHLAVDAGKESAVSELRRRKRRDHKPFALMARSLDVISRYCEVNKQEAALLQSPEAPIVILRRRNDPDADQLAPGVAPGQPTLGFMLPYTPLHLLLLRRMNRPVVLTSGNRSEEPQCTDNADACERLGAIADYVLLHNRPIVNRVDDSVVRVMSGVPRLLRRARGYAPTPLLLPPGFEDAGDWLALGGQLKNTFCLLRDGRAILSQHIGDLEDAATYADYEKNLELYQQLFQHRPAGLAVDRHPEYLSAKLGREWAARDRLPLAEVQHHHAHIAACLADNGWPLDAGPVLGVALDGLGYGDDGQLWGGEFLRADYRGFERLGTFKPVAMPGGARAMHEPWRNTYAHLMAELGWARLKTNFDELELVRFLETRPLQPLAAMVERGRHSPKASSCGRLFDAVAAAAGICRERASYEGQAAMELEAAIDRRAYETESEELDYPFAIPRLDGTGLHYIEPLAMWQALLGDLILETPPGVIAARFHRGLAAVIARMVHKLCTHDDQRVTDTVALSGGVFQNRTLFESVTARLEADGFRVLSHRNVPANDGGLALGQAVIAAANDHRRRS